MADGPAGARLHERGDECAARRSCGAPAAAATSDPRGRGDSITARWMAVARRRRCRRLRRLLPGRGGLEFGHALLERLELGARACQHLRLGVEFLACHQV